MKTWQKVGVGAAGLGLLGWIIFGSKTASAATPDALPDGSIPAPKPAPMKVLIDRMAYTVKAPLTRTTSPAMTQNVAGLALTLAGYRR